MNFICAYTLINIGFYSIQFSWSSRFFLHFFFTLHKIKTIKSAMKLYLFVCFCVQFCLINCYILEPGPVVKATQGIDRLTDTLIIMLIINVSINIISSEFKICFQRWSLAKANAAKNDGLLFNYSSRFIEF